VTYNLDSALVLVLTDAITWESATIELSGTLTAVDFNTPMDPLAYQSRDRQLAFRDLITAAAVIETSVQVSDVWNYPAAKPLLQGPVVSEMPPLYGVSAQAGNASAVRHVLNASVAADAARYADSDLYGRDGLIYETLARICQQTFTSPPISRLDAAGTIFGSSGSVGWSLAEGGQFRADINAGLPLQQSTFKRPDQNLAERDNQLAAYTAYLAQVLRNPFAFALRLYIQVDGVNSRESEVYTLESDDGINRTWVCEPALSNRNRIVYNIAGQTLQWFRENESEVQPPQIVALTIAGIDAGQTITTLASVPEMKDAQYWRSKAGQLQPPGTEITDTEAYLDFTSNGSVTSGGYLQPDCACLTVPGGVNFSLPGTLPPGDFRVSVLVEANSTVTILGNQNVTGVGGSDGGATFGTNFAPAPAVLNGSLQYRVIDGNGIVYGGQTYFDSQTFAGNPAYPSFTQAGPTPSVVNQYLIDFRLALPAGPWTVQMGYTNWNGDTTGFGVLGQFIAQGQYPIDAMEDVAPLPFSGTNGTVLVSAPSSFDIPAFDSASIPEFNFPVCWTYGDDGQLGIQWLTFASLAGGYAAIGTYALTAAFGGDTASAVVSAQNGLPEVIRFEFTVLEPLINPVLGLNWFNNAADQSSYIPLKLKQVQVQQVGTYDATPLANEFQGWRQECLNRAERVIQQNYNAGVLACLNAWGTVPCFRSAGSSWGADETENWMAFVETNNPRLREIDAIPQTGYIMGGRQYQVTVAPVVYNGRTFAEGDSFYGVNGITDYSTGSVAQVGAFVKSKPGHLGKPALIPNGLYFTAQGTVAAYYDTPLACPVVAACQPWMIDIGLYVAAAEFWLPETL
jgi:hypothetical protein